MNDYTSGASDPSDQSGGFVGNLPIILWQRRWLIVIPAVPIAIAAILAAYLLPQTYQSRAVLLVESQDLPTGVAGTQGENPIDRRMAKIRQQILSRPDLVELIQANNLYNAARHAEPLSKLVDRMRDATVIQAVDADIQSGARGNNGSIAFSLSFTYSQPAQAQMVAQTFVDRLVKLDASSTQAEAQTNVNFLTDQEQNLKTQLADVEGQINRITGVNGAALSSANLGMVGTGSGVDYSSQIAQLQRDNATLAVQSGSAVERDPNVVAAEGQLAAAKATYSDDHPDVKLAERRLAAARANARDYQRKGVSTLVQQQIAANNNAIAQLSQQRNLERSRAAAMLAAQARGPAVMQQVSQLQAKADNIRSNLGKISANLLNAQSMSKLVDQQRGERLTLIEPPVTPDRPSSPNRPLLIFGGMAAGLAFGVMLALLAELIFRPIRSVGQLTGVMGEPPLAVVPTLSGRARRSRKKGWFGRSRRRTTSGAV